MPGYFFESGKAVIDVDCLLDSAKLTFLGGGRLAV